MSTLPSGAERDGVSLPVPDRAPAPPVGCEWRHTTLIHVGDELLDGEHDLFGLTERFFLRVIYIEEKPKTFSVTLEPADPRILATVRRRWRKDEWRIVRST